MNLDRFKVVAETPDGETVSGWLVYHMSRDVYLVKDYDGPLGGGFYPVKPETVRPVEQTVEVQAQQESDDLVYCDECGGGPEDGTYVYERTVANGQVWHCSTCNRDGIHRRAERTQP